MRLRHLGPLVALMGIALVPAPALAFDWIATVRVNAIEVSHAPDRIPFFIDGPGGSCAVAPGLGTAVTWSTVGLPADKAGTNAQAILATLLTARATGRQIQVYGTNAGCRIEFLYLL